MLSQVYPEKKLCEIFQPQSLWAPVVTLASWPDPCFHPLMSNSQSEPKDQGQPWPPGTDWAGPSVEALGGGLAPLFEWRGLKQPPGGLERLAVKVCVFTWSIWTRLVRGLLNPWFLAQLSCVSYHYDMYLHIIHLLAAVLDQYLHVWCRAHTTPAFPSISTDQGVFGLPAGRFCSWSSGGLLSNIPYQWRLVAEKIIYQWRSYTNLIA